MSISNINQVSTKNVIIGVFISLIIIIIGVKAFIFFKPTLHNYDNRPCKIGSYHWGWNYEGRICLCFGKLIAGPILLDAPGTSACNGIGLSFENPKNLFTKSSGSIY
ncbi:hypothetical protein A2691_01070 [Candidatus Woesebacteria bacterium RIFCSPHIGHO2_01_FULL_39_23]|nr:MAG: hypothetical protein A2691_01070 [Candidatus Woesebacteria bacterium RIFCSPHIGHO2_01_FULL_39_23]